MADRLNTALSSEELVVNESNARKKHETDPALVASIASAGLMYPITVKPIDGGLYEVIDGARRLYAIRWGVRTGAIDMPRIPVKIIENGLDSLEYSLHGNLHMAMHPLDEAEAIDKLSKREEDRGTIAARFGKTVTWVDQRAKLSGLIPEVKNLYRESQIDLETAMAFTLADAKTQKAIVKARQYDNAQVVRRMATQTKVNAKEAIFDLELVPEEKIERDLFSDDIWITSIPLFLKLQGEAFDAKVKEYKDKGYNDVIVLKDDDWQTVNKYAAVQGKVTDKMLGKLTCLLQLSANGKFRVWENMIPNKEAKKVKASADGPNKAEADAIVEKTAKDLTMKQNEFLAAQAASAMVSDIESGEIETIVMDWILVTALLGAQSSVPWIQTTRASFNAERRWSGIKTSNPTAAPDQSFGFEVCSLADWKKKPVDQRQKLVLAAYASLINPPYGIQNDALKDMPIVGWAKPDESFFNGYRTDQLEDYLHKSKIKPKEHEGLKKGDLVKMCANVAKTDTAWRFGFK